MRDHLILLPGWGLGNAPLEPMVAALRGLDEGLQVDIQPLPALASNDPADWLDALDAQIPMDAWLGGWSLGGMLAAELAARRGSRCSGLLGLASNACFVAQEDWPWAMSVSTFRAFFESCAGAPEQILKRFSLLCSQGGGDARRLARDLLADATHTPVAVLLAGLEVLGRLDTRAALTTFQGPQLHLFAGADALLPGTAASALLGLPGNAEGQVLEQASHAFVLERADDVAAAIQAFIHREAEHG